MVESFHGLVDQIDRFFGAFLGEVKINHGGLEATVAHISLHYPGVDPGFQKMSGIAMPEGMYGNPALIDAGIEFGTPEGALETVEDHGLLGSRCFVMSSANSGKNEDRVAMGDPIAAEQMIGLLGKRHIAVLGSLAAVDMEHHSLAVDVGNLDGQRFRNPQAACLNSGKAGVVVKCFDAAEDAENLFLIENTGQLFVLL